MLPLGIVIDLFKVHGKPLLLCLVLKEPAFMFFTAIFSGVCHVLSIFNVGFSFEHASLASKEMKWLPHTTIGRLIRELLAQDSLKTRGDMP